MTTKLKRGLVRTLVVTLLMFCTNAMAETPYPWRDGRAYTALSGEWDGAMASFSYSQDGRKYIDFAIVPKNGNEACRANVDESVFKVNGQPIKGWFWCNSFTDSGERYYRFAARTKAGDAFLIDTFKRSEEVLIEHDLKTFRVSAIGFTVEWNSSDSQAL